MAGCETWAWQLWLRLSWESWRQGECKHCIWQQYWSGLEWIVVASATFIGGAGFVSFSMCVCVLLICTQAKWMKSETDRQTDTHLYHCANDKLIGNGPLWGYPTLCASCSVLHTFTFVQSLIALLKQRAGLSEHFPKKKKTVFSPHCPIGNKRKFSKILLEIQQIALGDAKSDIMSPSKPPVYETRRLHNSYTALTAQHN